MKTHYRSRVWRITTRAAATLCFVGALVCFVAVAVGGAFPSYKRGSSIVAPRTGDVWQVGEMHTAQWTLTHVRTTNSSGDPIMARFILAYSGDSQNAHVLLAELTDWFPATDRLANVMVPSVPTRDDYSLYLFSRDNHDVSAWSGYISIFNPEDVEGSDQPPDKLVVTTAPPVSVTMSLTSTFFDSALSTIPDVASVASATASVVNQTEASTVSSSGSGLGSIASFPSASAKKAKTVPMSAAATPSGTEEDLHAEAAPAAVADTPVARVQTSQSVTTPTSGTDESADADATPTATNASVVHLQMSDSEPSPTHRMKRARRCCRHDKRLQYP